MFRCNLTNGRGKTNLFDVELLLIVNATAEFSLFPCANNYSRELSATFFFFSSPSPLLVHVLLPVFDVSFRPREIFIAIEINTIYNLLFRAVSNNHSSKNKSFNVLFHKIVYALDFVRKIDSNWRLSRLLI